MRVGLRDAGGQGGRFLRGLEQQRQVTPLNLGGFDPTPFP